jgi:aryl-alcohol dehydrogenase-like predicted oxidoreductase
MRSLDVSETGGFERCVCLQPQYSLVERNIEREVLPVCVEEGLGVIPWSPLGSGFPSGKYRRDEEPAKGSRISEAVESMEEHWDRRATERNWATLDVMGRISEETGKSYAQISLNWLLRQDGVTSPIIGARTLEQLEDNIGASGWELTSEQFENSRQPAPWKTSTHTVSSATPSGCRGRSSKGASRSAPTGKILAWAPMTSTFA